MIGSADETTVDDLRERYLQLLKRSLTRTGYEGSFSVVPILKHPTGRGRVVAAVQTVMGKRGYFMAQKVDPARRAIGTDRPSDAETMVGMARLDNFQWCIETVLEDKIPGDIIETGAWRGGACILARAVLAAYGVTDRTVWAADSFAGLPRPDPRYPADTGADFHKDLQLAVSISDVKENFLRYGLLDDQVQFLVGWFKDTLPTAPIEELSVARLDGDMYESTIQALEILYPKLSPGGFLIVDDYRIPNCRAAVTDYRRDHSVDEPIEAIDDSAVYWRKSAS